MTASARSSAGSERDGETASDGGGRVSVLGRKDIGKKNHHAVVIDADGKRLLSRLPRPAACSRRAAACRAAGFHSDTK
ncbi:hypothetical protein [Streptomyces sp. NBC_01716]|uniref:hypothetical protein n=1 Tax=Streptomyces sp. NBC_01716 TaxID=2975917 RepID=UPI002E35A208|nr:hypothetical protein [Streptomyces sp. NBC_01716]